MFSRPAAVLLAFVVLFCSAFATYGQAGAAAPVGEALVQATTQDAGSPGRDVAGAAEQAHEAGSPTASQVEAGADSPEGVAQLVDPPMPAAPGVRPRPLDAAAWQAPTLDALRRPPRAGLPTA